MAKRIFKVIGIVLASIVGFTGVVVGVMAIMGKFKKPVVYPQQLVFAEQEIVVVDNGEYQTVAVGENELSLSKETFTFELKGYSNEEHEVTEKTCLLTVLDNSNLIKLTNQSGEPLTPEANGRFKINCNEPTYFRLIEPAVAKFTGESYGKVNCYAHDENMKTRTEIGKDLTIWIDRKIKSVKIDTTGVADENVKLVKKEGVDTTDISLGLDESLMFNAVSTPTYALNPMSKTNCGEKIVEYFYFTQPQGWQFIDQNSISQYDFLTYNNETGKIVFKVASNMAGQTYTFKMAVFETYAKREQYLQNIGQDEDNIDRMAQMITSQFSITVKSTKITEIGTVGTNLTLNLFEKNGIVLNDSEPGYSNLGLYMKGAGVYTSLRFDETNFELRNSNYINTNNIEDFLFKSLSPSDFEGENNENKLSLNSHNGNTFIDFFVYNMNTKTYRLATETEFAYSANYVSGTRGDKRAFEIVAMSKPNIQNTNEKLVLGILVVNSTGEYYITSLDVASVEARDLNFEYVNTNRVYNLEIAYTKQQNGNAFYPTFGELDFDGVVKINSGCYRACVLVTPKNSDGDEGKGLYNVDVLENITFTKDGKEYVLVGYAYGNKFVNKIRANKDAKSNSTKLYMLQLQNDFENSTAEDYINSIVNNKITENFVITDQENSQANTIKLNKAYISNDNEINIFVKYNIENVKDTLEFSNITTDSSAKDGSNLINTIDNHPNLVAGFDYKISLSSSVQGLIENLFNANQSNIADYFNVLFLNKSGEEAANDNMFTIESINLSPKVENSTENRVIVVTFRIAETADSSRESANNYSIKFNFGGVEKTSPLISALSNQPTNVLLEFKSNEGAIVVVELENAVLNVTMKANANGEYDYGYVLKYTVAGVSGEQTYEYGTADFVLNPGNSDTVPDIPTFKLAPNYKTNTINYTIEGKAIESLKDANLSVGSHTLFVTCGNLSKSLAVNVTAVVNPTDDSNKENGYFTYTKPNNGNTLQIVAKDKQVFKLNSGDENLKGVDYKYFAGKEDTTGTPLPKLLEISNVEFSFSGSESLKIATETDENNTITSYTIKTVEGEQNVLTISRADDDWTLTKYKFLNTRLAVSFNVRMATEANPISVQIDFSSSRQVDKNSNWTKIYAGTQINFVEQKSGNEDFATNALFKVRLADGSTETLTCTIYKMENNVVITTTDYYADRFAENGSKTLDVGSYVVTFKVGEEVLATFNNLTVEPNVFMTLKDGTELTSETDHNLADIFTFNAYKDTKDSQPYGTDGNTNEIYTDIDLKTLEGAPADVANFNAETDIENLITLENGKLKIGVLKELNKTTECQLTIKYVGTNFKLFSAILKIKNNRSFTDDSNNQFMVNKDNLTAGFNLTGKSLTLKSIKVGDNSATAKDGKYIYTKNISAKQEVMAVYNFDGSDDGNNKFTYTKTITLIPYVPTTNSKKDTTETTSQNNAFNIVAGTNGVFESIDENIIKNIYISSVKVNCIENDTIITTQANDSVIGVGYLNGGSKEVLVKIGAIVGNSLNIEITYHIDYMGDDQVSYEYTHTLVVNNYLSIKEQYPYSDQTTQNDLYFMAKDTNNLDNLLEYAKHVGKDYTNTGNNIVSFAKGLNFEPVDMGQEIRFDRDDVLSIRRALVRNLNNENVIMNAAIAKVELVAYQNNQNVRLYVSGNYIQINGSKVKFTQSSDFSMGSNGYFLFKITTTSGNYCYYLIRLQKPKNNNEFKDFKIDNGELNSFVQAGTDESGKINIIPRLTGPSPAINTNLNTKLTDYSNLKFYLMGVGTVTSYELDNLTGLTELDIGRYSMINTTTDESGIATYKIDNPNTFQTIKVAIVYETNDFILVLGCCTTNISVDNLVANNVKTKEGELGHYTATIGNLEEITITTSVPESVSITLTGDTANYFNVVGNTIKSANGDEKIITINTNGSVQASCYATHNLAFIVEYKISNTTIFVEFTFAGVPVEQISDVTLGLFDKTTGFNTALDLSSRIGNYVGGLSATEGDNSLTIENKTITFSQDNSTQTHKIKLTFDKLFDLTTGAKLTREFNVSVYPAYSIEQTVGTNSNPAKATKNTDNQFNSNKGSSLEFTKTEYKPSESADALYVTYYIDGLSIYVASGYTLQISSAEHYNYVVSGDSVLESKDGHITIDGTTNNLNFVHTAQPKTIQLSINLMNGNDKLIERNGTNPVEINLFVTLPPTYSTLAATYAIEGSNHDNIASGTAINNILDTLFGTSKRMKLVLTTSSSSDDSTKDFNIEAMGFKDSKNPNYLQFILGDGLSLTEAGNVFNLKADSGITSQIQTWFRLTNLAGLESETYNICILPKAEKLVYHDDSDLIAENKQNYLEIHSAWDGNTQFASVVINDMDASVAYDYSAVSSQNIIAKLYDIRNNVFKIQGSVINYDEEKNVYTYSNGSYTVTFSLNSNREIVFNIERTAGASVLENALSISFTITTNSGVLCTMNFNIFNYNISSTDTDYYATETFQLGNLLSVKKADKTEENVTYDLLTDCGSYFVEGNSYSIKGTSNDLFVYKASNKTITTYQVPSTAQITAYIKISTSSTTIAIVQRVITIKRNVQFVIKDNPIQDPDSTLETTHNMTIGDSEFVSYSIKDSLELQFVKTGAEFSMNSNNTSITVDKVEVADYTSAKPNEYVTINGLTSLTFIKDFTGDVTLKLGFKTNFGFHYQYWTIHVTGCLTLKYRYTPTAAFESNGTAYNSGSEVTIVSTNETDQTSAMTVVSNNISEWRMTLGLAYKYLTYEEYAKVTSVNDFKNFSWTNATNNGAWPQFKTNLALVPQSSNENPVDYYVVYKMTYIYNKQGTTGGNTKICTNDYYAVYKVRNTATISVAPGVNTEIDVNGTTPNAVYSKADTTLNLFYYSETFNDGSVVTYLGGKKLRIKNTDYSNITIDGKKITAGEGENKHIIDYSSSVPTLKSDSTYSRTGYETYSISSMFECKYANMLEFINFIDTINSININGRKFTALTNSGGLFGVDLTAHNDDYLFQNTETVTLKVIAQNTEVFTFNDLTLTTSTTLSPKGSFWLSQIFQDGSYVTDYQIVGIGSPSSGWVNNASGAKVKNDNVSKFTVNKNTYTVKLVTFSGNGGTAKLCQLSADYYVLTGADYVYAVDYMSQGYSNCFRVQYKEGSDSSIDLTNVVVKFANNSTGALKKNPITLTSLGIQTKTEAELKGYKKDNSEAVVWSETYTTTYDGITMTVVVLFELPPKEEQSSN